MTAFDLCRQRPELELTPVLRIVKYLGLDSSELEGGEIDRVVRLYPFFQKDPELVIGSDDVAAETGLEPEAVETVLHERRRDIPYLGTARRPMVPRVALGMIRAAAEGRDPLELEDSPGNGSRRPGAARNRPEPEEPAARAADGLESRLQSVAAELRSVAEKLEELTREVRDRSGGNGVASGARPATPRHRRKGGGKPDTIVEACRLVLDGAAGPMKVAEITREVLSQGVEINAKNPNVTVSSILSSYEVFRRVKRGYYVLTG